MYLKINNEVKSISSFSQTSSYFLFIFPESLNTEDFENASTIDLYSDDDMYLCKYILDDFNVQFNDKELYLKNIITSVNINSYKQKKIEISKQSLSDWLEKNPMRFTDGKYYSVTSEKQSLLNGNLASYERALNAGIEYTLKWNSTGEECIEWEYADLLALSLSIAAYVAPKVSMQQSIEVAINNCSTIEEIDAIVIDYNA